MYKNIGPTVGLNSLLKSYRTCNNIFFPLFAVLFWLKNSCSNKYRVYASRLLNASKYKDFRCFNHRALNNKVGIGERGWSQPGFYFNTYYIMIYNIKIHTSWARKGNTWAMIALSRFAISVCEQKKPYKELSTEKCQ